MIKRGKEWSWMNKLDTKKDWCHYSGMPSPSAYKESNMKKRRKVKRTLKVKIIRFFQDETTQRILEWLLVIGLIVFMSRPWAE